MKYTKSVPLSDKLFTQKTHWKQSLKVSVTICRPHLWVSHIIWMPPDFFFALKNRNVCLKKDKREICGQFHPCSTRSFYVRKLRAQLFCACVLGLYFIGARLLAQKLRAECWWNWPMVVKMEHLLAWLDRNTKVHVQYIWFCQNVRTTFCQREKKDFNRDRKHTCYMIVLKVISKQFFLHHANLNLDEHI